MLGLLDFIKNGFTDLWATLNALFIDYIPGFFHLCEKKTGHFWGQKFIFPAIAQ